MSEELELSISELRRKKRSTSGNSNGSSNHHEDHEFHNNDSHGFRSEETWIDPEPRPRQEPRSEPRESYRPVEPPRGDDDAIRLPFDPIRLFEALKRNLGWCILASMLFCALGLSWFFIGGKSYIQVQLARKGPPPEVRSEDGASFQPQSYTDPALINLMQAPEMVRRVAANVKPPIPVPQLAKSLLVFQEREAEVVTLVFNGKATPQQAADVLNIYAQEIIKMTKEMQAREVEQVIRENNERLTRVSEELNALKESISKLPAESRIVDSDKQTEAYLTQLADLETKYQLLQIDIQTTNPIKDKIQIAREELAEMLLRYTDEHPTVQRQREKIKTLEQQAADAANNPNAGKKLEDLRADNVHVVSSTDQKQSLSKQAQQMKVLIENIRGKLSGLSQKDTDDAILHMRYQALAKIRDTMARQQREAEVFQQNPPGFYTLLAPATTDRVFTKGHLKKTIVFAVMGAMFGMFLVGGFVMAKELLDEKLKTVTDVELATGLPILGTLGDLNKMSAAEQKAWAFRTWTILKGKLTRSQTQGLVCGFISAHQGEGRSTWVKLLVNTANQRGLRVLTVSTQPSSEPAVHPHESGEENGTGESQPESADKQSQKSDEKSLIPNAFSFPAQVAKQLNDPDNAYPVVHIPLPGWVWNLERRKQWQNALSHWRKIDNLVLLVELPPASEPESILLAEKVPHVIWLADSGKANLKETKEHIETLRHAGCNLVGAVLNREPASFLRRQLSRWMTMGALLFVLGNDSLQAQEANTNAPSRTIRSMSVSRTERAPWQEKLTLGPGDVLNLGFFGETNLMKNEVAIAPDGRISYLQATDVMAAGLTIDELRAALDKELGKYYRAPRTIVTPVTFKSKKYYVLGKVMNRGVFTLERPLTVVEALAKANGVETGLLNRNSIDLADLQRSFLVRRGQRIAIDFERLLNQGDLSQNLAIEPDDFLYFPPTSLREVYVVGEVRTPGVVPYTSHMTLLAALTDRGGFGQKAYKSRVLVVRGSLNQPETFVVNMHDVVDGKMTDFKLQPKDIVYVSHRPFIKAEELLDMAATGFIQSAVTAWTGQYVGPVIKRPFINGIYDND